MPNVSKGTASHVEDMGVLETRSAGLVGIGALSKSWGATSRRPG
jgi:hypothetical protein